MNYHNITHDDMNNGTGLRVVLWLAGCSHHCENCQNPITWNPNGGIPFDEKAKRELFYYLDKDYISGITFSGGDPLNQNNIFEVDNLIKDIKYKYGDNKSIWIYTGYTWEEILYNKFLLHTISLADVLVDGKFVELLKDSKYHWAGSTNQRVIDIHNSICQGKVILYEHTKK